MHGLLDAPKSSSRRPLVLVPGSPHCCCISGAGMRVRPGACGRLRRARATSCMPLSAGPQCAEVCRRAPPPRCACCAAVLPPLLTRWPLTPAAAIIDCSSAADR